MKLKLAQHPIFRKILASLIGVTVGGVLLMGLRLTVLSPGVKSSDVKPGEQLAPIVTDKQPPKPHEIKIADSSLGKPPEAEVAKVTKIDVVVAEKTEEKKTSQPPGNEKSKMDVLLQQGGEKLASGNIDEAIEIYRQAVKLEPKNPAPLRELAMGLLLGGKHKESVEVYRKIIKFDPDDDTARYNLATSFFRSKDFYEAEQIYVDLLTRDPGNTKVLSNLATLYYLQGKLSYAAEHWGEVVRLEPKNADAHTMLGEVLMDLSKYTDAMKEYSAAASLQPDSMDAWLNLAISAHKAGGGGRALTAIERTIKLDPKNPRALAMRGDIFIDIYRTPGNKNKTALNSALESWEQSLKLKPDQPPLRKRLEFYRNLLNSK